MPALLRDGRDQAPGDVPALAVHDEIVIECAANQTEVASTWLKKAMLDAMAPLIEPVPVEVEFTIGPTWAGRCPPCHKQPENGPTSYKLGPVSASRSNGLPRSNSTHRSM